MIAGLDSSIDRPNVVQARQAYAAGVRAWGGYLGSRNGLGLYTRWSREDFAVLQQAGITGIGFCSGWDDPNWIRATAVEWGVLACVDVEAGIREDGPWVSEWVQQAQCGLYGAMSVHYETGEAPGRGALFNIMAWYPGFDPRATWYDNIRVRPPGPCGWQWQGTHQEFGLGVDSLWLDDIILPYGPGRGGGQEVSMSAGSAITIDGRLIMAALGQNGNVALASSTGGLGGLEGGSYLEIGAFTSDLRDLWLGYDQLEDGTKRLLLFGADGEGSVYGCAVSLADWSLLAPWALIAKLRGYARVPMYQGQALPVGAPGPQGPPGASAKEVADEIGRRISNG